MNVYKKSLVSSFPSVPISNVGPVINVGGVVYAWDGAQYVVSGGTTPSVKSLETPSYPYGTLAGTVASISAGYTVSNVVEIPDDVVAVKYVPHNSLSSDAVIDAVSIVGVQSISNANTKTTATPITFDGAHGTTAKKTSYAGQVPRVVSDLTPIQIVSRTDGGTGALVLLRQYVSSTAIGLRNTPSNNTYAKTVAGGAASGDKTQLAITSAANSMYSLGELILYRKTPALRVVSVGDSTILAIGGSGPADGGAIAQACFELGVQHSMYAQDGQSHEKAMKNLDALISTGQAKNSLVFLQAWSQNSGSSNAIIDLCWFNTLAMLDKLSSVGSIGILVSPAPITGNPSSAQYAWDKLVASGLLYVDQSTPLRQSDWTYVPAYTQDGVHYNAAGEAVIRPAFKDMLSRYV